MPMIAMPRPQWKARETLPQFDEEFRIMSGSNFRSLGLLFDCALRAPAAARPDSLLSEPRRFELFQIKPPDGAKA